MEIAIAYLFEGIIGDGEPHLILGIQFSAPIAENLIESIAGEIISGSSPIQLCIRDCGKKVLGYISMS